MKKSLFHKFIILLIVLPALACGLMGEDPTPTPAPTEAIAATSTPLPPTDTPEPPTETPVPPTDTPEPTPTPDITAGFESYESEELGLAVQYPADWAIDDFFLLLLASDQSILDTIFSAPDEIRDGAVVVLNADSTETLGDDPVMVVTDAFAEFDLSDDAAIVDGPDPIVIQGQDGAMARIEGTLDETGEAMVGLVFAVVNGDRAAAGLGFTKQEHEGEYLPLIEAIFSTIVVSEPTVSETESEVPADPPTVENSVMLSVGDTFASSFEENSPRDFLFNGQANSPITINVEPIDDGLDLVLEIFDADLNSLIRVDDTVTDEAEAVVFSRPADGQYFLRVSDYYGEAGNFNISVTEGGAAQIPADSNTLNAGEIVLGRLEGEPANYLISGSAGVPSTVFLIPEENFDATLTMVGPDGTILVEEVDDGFSGETEAISFTPKTDTDLIVTVDGFGQAQGGYAIFLIDPATATTAEGSVPEGGEQTFRVCVPANTSPVIFVDPEEGFDVVVSLTAPDGTLNEEIDNGFDGEPEAVILRDNQTPEIDYAVIITVRGFADQGGSFAITISSTSPDGVVLDGC